MEFQKVFLSAAQHSCASLNSIDCVGRIGLIGMSIYPANEMNRDTRSQRIAFEGSLAPLECLVKGSCTNYALAPAAIGILGIYIPLLWTPA